MARPWDTIEKVDMAFSAHNHDESRLGRARFTVIDFQKKCLAGLNGITQNERAAINRWAASKMRG